METVLSFIARTAILLYASSSMASVGVGHELREVAAPLGRPSMLATALLANFVAVPLLGVLLVRAFELPPPQATGLLLLACAAGAAFLLALTRLAGANTALAGGLLLILVPFTILYVPIVVPRLLPGATVDAFAVARELSVTMLLPLALGAVFRRRFRRLVPRAMPVLRQVSMTSLVVLLGATVLANLAAVRAILVTPALPAAVLLVFGSLLIGFLGSVPSTRARVVLALGTGQRNVAAAMIVAASGFATPEPLVMVVVTSLVGFAVLFPAAFVFRRLLARRRADARRVRFGRPEAGAVAGRRRVQDPRP